MRSKQSFYSWYIGLQVQQEHFKYLLDNVGYKRGISYGYKGGRTNKRYSIVENEAEELEELKASYSKIMNTILIISNAMIDIIYNNSLGYKVVRAKLNKKDIRKVKGNNTLKACKEAEQRAIEYIRDYLNENGIVI